MDKFVNYCEKYNFISDDNKIELQRILNRNMFKILHIETYTLNPYMLLLRANEKNVASVIENGEIFIHKKDKYKTSIANIILDKITNCIVKRCNDMQYEIVFAIHNIYYKLLVVC